MGFCQNCGLQLGENANFCPRCGDARQNDNQQRYTQAPLSPKHQYDTKPYQPDLRDKLNPLAVAGLVTSCASLFLTFWGIAGVVGCVLSAVGYSQIKKTGERGVRIAVAGIACGVIGTLYGLLLLIIMLNLR